MSGSSAPVVNPKGCGPIPLEYLRMKCTAGLSGGDAFRWIARDEVEHPLHLPGESDLSLKESDCALAVAPQVIPLP